MTGPGFRQLPPEVDFAEPGVDTLCQFCGNVETESGECVVCEPRCLVEDTPLRCNGFIVDNGGNVREMAAPS